MSWKDKDNLLRNFANSQRPSKLVLDLGYYCAERIFEKLSQSRDLFVDRGALHGSIPGGTALINELKQDFDLAIFLNGNVGFPPYNESLLQGIVSAAESAIPGRIKCKVAKLVVDCMACLHDYNISVDIMATPNLAGNSRVQMIERQANQTKLLMHEVPITNEIFAPELTPGMHETTTAYTKGIPEDWKSLARLAKYWDRKLRGNETKIKGRSFTIQLVMYSLMKGDFLPENFVETFRIFLERMKDLKDVEIIFEGYYKRSEIPKEILNQRPLIMHPVYPYENFGTRFPSLLLQRWSQGATITLKKLSEEWLTIDELFSGL